MSGDRATTREENDTFVGENQLLGMFYDQLQQFEEWNQQRDWLAFHNHHYDWWTFPINEISSRGHQFQLPEEVIVSLRQNPDFIKGLRRAVDLLMQSWAWDVKTRRMIQPADEKQKWSFWPVRLYKAGKSLWLFHQHDYFESLKMFALEIKKKNKLEFFSQRLNSRAEVIEEWEKLEKFKS